MATIELGKPVSLLDVSGVLVDAVIPVYGSPEYGYDLIVTIETGTDTHIMPCDVEELTFHERH